MKKNITVVLLIAVMSFCLMTSAMMKKEFPAGWKLNKYMPQYEYVPRGLLVFLDDGEKGLGAITSGLISALGQNAGPIISSSSLLHSLSECHKKIFTDEDLRRFAEKEDLSQQKCIASLGAGVDFDQWVIKKINDSLYLLIPHRHLDSLKILKENIAFEPDRKMDNISEIELKLGLKVNHMQTIDDIKKINQPVEHEYADYFMDALFNENTKNSDIFCMRSDYYRSKNPQPAWVIYMDGHGNMRSSIVGMKLNDFKKVLDFFDQKIITKLCVYSSCYAGGINIELLYKDAENPVQKTYSFPIIVQALTDVETVMRRDAYVDAGGKAVFETSCYYDDFLAKATSLDEAITYEDVLSSIMFQSEVEDIPQIKLPGIEWFSVMEVNKKVASIGSILAKTRDPLKPLNVVTFFRKRSKEAQDPEVLLLYAHNIPFEVVINSDKVKTIVSMIPGDAVHTIKKISSQFYVWDLFRSLKDLGPEKIFFIELVISVNNMYKNVIVHNEKKSVKIFYLQNDQCYVLENRTVNFCDDKQKQEYAGLVERAHFFEKQMGDVYYKIKPIVDATWHSIGSIALPIDGIVVFEKIEGQAEQKDAPRDSISGFLRAFQDNLKKRVVKGNVQENTFICIRFC